MGEHGVTGEVLASSPLGAVFLLTAAEAALPAQDVARPDTTMEIAAEAVELMSPWRGDEEEHARRRERAVAAAAGLSAFADAILRDPGAAWWTQDLLRDRQVWLSSSSFDMRPRVAEPTIDREARGTVAQHPSTWWLSSTEFGNASSSAAVVACEAGDWGFFPHDTIERRTMRVPAAARVFEIHGPRDFHVLAARYPLPITQPQWPSSVGEIAIDWAAAAEDWDGVHLSMWGLLTGFFVEIGTAEGTTRLWSWDCESTLWLRDVFEIADTSQRVKRDDVFPPRRIGSNTVCRLLEGTMPGRPFQWAEGGH